MDDKDQAIARALELISDARLELLDWVDEDLITTLDEFVINLNQEIQ